MMPILSTLCYIQRGGQYLMLYRNAKKNDLNAGKWIGVGGKFEDGESPEDCLRREVLEETGLSLTRFAFRGIVTFVSDESPTEYMHLFTADGFEGELTCCNEGTLAWQPMDRLEQLPMWVGDRVFLRLLAQNAPFFSLKLVYQGSKLVQAWLNGQKMPL